MSHSQDLHVPDLLHFWRVLHFTKWVVAGYQFSIRQLFKKTQYMLNYAQGGDLMDVEEPDYDRILQKQDFFPKIFLIPSEIILDKDEGIKVLKRDRKRPDKYTEERVRDITIDEQQIRNKSFTSLENLNHPAGHGLISLFKRTPTRRIKLAICICVYSQPKYMLKNTIKGIQQSYKHFLNKAGILPHQIILTVIFDGIEKLNNSKDQTENMISFFHQIDLKNGFVRKPYGKSLDEYFKDLEQRNFHLSRLEEERMEDFNLFTSQQLQDLEFKLFQNQYNEYTRIKQLLVEIEELKKKKNIKLDSLPVDIYKKYEEICTRFCMENNLYYETQEQIQQYLENKRNIKIKLIYEAINEMQALCNKYLESRENTSILYPVRLQTDDFLNPKLNPDEEQEKLNKNKKKEYNYMFFVVKHKNEGKLSSHMLFFEGFCKLFDPQYCMLTDVGMKPHDEAVYLMWEHMELNPKVGGVCGYMNLKMQNAADDLGYREDGFEEQEVGCLTRLFEKLTSVQRAQQFEYHFAHMLDKPFEAAFRYIHVLPGAFSAYRWKALKSISYEHEEPEFRLDDYIAESERNWSDKELRQEEQEETLMRRYLKTAFTSHSNADLLSLEDSNMYLAEDRIMCLGIHTLGYDLEYLPDAESSVDPVTSLTRLLGQRRRWINGSWFAFNYVREHTHERTTFIFLIQIIYYTLVQALAWLGPSIFYIAMNLTLTAAVREYIVPIFLDFFNIMVDYQLDNYRIGIFNIKNVIESIPDLINYVYILLVFSIVLYSVLVNHNNPRYKKVYYMASTAFGIYGMIVVALLVYNTYEIIFRFERPDTGEDNFIIPVNYLRVIILFVLGGHALPILWSMSFKKCVQCLSSVFSYIYYTPTYINILQVFAFCRIDDLSWGTKGLDNDGEAGTARQWERRKYIFVLQFVSTNVIFGYVIISLSDYDFPRNTVILATTCLVAFLLLVRLLGAFIYIAQYYLVKWFCKKLPKGYANKNLTNGNRILNALKQIQLRIKEIEKIQVKKKKKAEQEQTTQLISQIATTRNIGVGIIKRVTEHMMHNGVLSKKDLGQKKQKKKISLRKKLKIVEEASIEESQESNSKNQKTNYNLVIPEAKKETDIKSKIKALKERKKNGK